MDDLGTMVAFVVLAVGVVLSRVISERAFRRLDDQMKIAIMNEFSGMRIWNIVPVLAIVIFMVAGNAFYAGHELLVFGLFVVALVAYFIITHRMIRKKMVKVQAPESYLRKFMAARWISYLTIVVMFAVMLGAGIVKGFVEPGVGR
jgi:hypothetical protein